MRRGKLVKALVQELVGFQKQETQRANEAIKDVCTLLQRETKGDAGTSSRTRAFARAYDLLEALGKFSAQSPEEARCVEALRKAILDLGAAVGMPTGPTP